ncbi:MULTISPECIES: hypothetical protein [unclassified Corynebacterium]|uniref:hypothetical protein n=1 Tax=unclassified Corynebacterium TaxID=2624378 RepID=UPI000B2030CA|nr:MULTISPECIES: hypothetical protein [unclassified Corynebacterium]
MNTSRRTPVHTPATTRPGSTTRKATSHRALVAGILATTALAFTACSTQETEAAPESAAPVETTTVTQTEDGVSDKSSGNTPNPTGSAPDQGGDTSTAETGGASTSSSERGDNGDGSRLRQDMTAEIYNNPSPGSTFMAAGEQATTCIYGDGYGLNLIAAGPNTSCDFAKAVFNQQTEGLNASEDNIRDHLQPNIKAKSPATGKTYDLSCSTQDDVVVCTGGNNAKFYMY